MEYKKNTFDMIFGHFDISQNFLTADHIDAIRRKNNISDDLLKEIIKNDRLLMESGINDLGFDRDIVEDTFINHKPASELIGEWITIVKERGIILEEVKMYEDNQKSLLIKAPSNGYVHFTQGLLEGTFLSSSVKLGFLACQS